MRIAYTVRTRYVYSSFYTNIISTRILRLPSLFNLDPNKIAQQHKDLPLCRTETNKPSTALRTPLGEKKKSSAILDDVVTLAQIPSESIVDVVARRHEALRTVRNTRANSSTSKKSVVCGIVALNLVHLFCVSQPDRRAVCHKGLGVG